MDEQTSTARQSDVPVEASERIFVGGLAWAMTDEDLKKTFDPYGATEAEIVRYPDSGRSRGFGFVSFETVLEAKKATEEMDGKEVFGRAIKIGYARAKQEKQAAV